MALTRKLLKGMGLADEQVETIIEAHTETVEGLKAEATRYKADAEALPGVQKQLEQAQAYLKAGEKDSYKVKYEALKEEFEGYKEIQSKKETHAAKESAYRALLKEAGISERRLEAVLKVSDVDSVELNESGGIKDAAKLTESVKTEWADFITTTSTQGAKTANPPTNNAGKAYTRAEIQKMSPAEINENWDAIKTSLKTTNGGY